MGAVFEAWDTALERPVALKVLHPRLLTNPRDAARIVAEARAAAALCHPNIVRVHALVEHDDVTAIDMEFVEGKSLNTVLQSGRLGAVQVVCMLRQVLSALDVVHKRGMAHLDLKPSNIMVTPDGRIILTDFGLARAVGATESGELSIWSTPRYAPPELRSGATPTIAWDIFAAGVVCIECLLSDPPKAPSAKETINWEQMASRISEASPELVALLARMAAKNPKQRPGNATETLAALQKTPEYHQSLVSSGSLLVLPKEDVEDVIATELIDTWPRRKRFSLGIAGAALAVTMILAVLFMLPSARTTVEAPINQSPADESTRASSAPTKLIGCDPRELTFFSGALYFSADDGVHGRELWRVSGDVVQRIAEVAKDLVPASPRRLFSEAGSGLYFVGDTPEYGGELYRLGDNAEYLYVALVKDIVKGPMGSGPIPVCYDFPTLYFFARTRDEGEELWATFGDEEHTAIVEDLCKGPSNFLVMQPRFLKAATSIFMMGYTDGATGIHLVNLNSEANSVRDICDVNEDALLLGAIGDRALYSDKDPEHDWALWIADPVNAPQFLKKIAATTAATGWQDCCELGGKVLFRAFTPEYGEELWNSDGTPEGTVLLRDIQLGPGNSMPQSLRALDGFAVFSADDGIHGRELWASDGTPEGTVMIADANPGVKNSNPHHYRMGNKRLAFSATDDAHGEELWLARFSDGKWSAELTFDLYPGPQGSGATDVRLDEHRSAYFSAELPGAGRQLVHMVMTNDGVYEYMETIHIKSEGVKVETVDLRAGNQ
ncbi:MAG: protein kinase [Candidatus Hydrogenedentes bacterium]|nr:protein kinase [Candidatus Hydrogenedentota bacterium]